MTDAFVPPSEKYFVLSYFPNFCTGIVPPGVAKPVESAFAPIAFNRLQKYLLIGIVATFDGVPTLSSELNELWPFAQSLLLLPGLMSVAAFSTLMAQPVLK